MANGAPIRLDLTKTLEAIGKGFVKRMRQLITQQKAMDFSRAKPLAESTLAGRRRRGVSSTRRLEDTGALRRDGFVVEASKMRLEVGLSDAPHPRSRTTSAAGPVQPASFDQIGAWNQADTNPKPWTHNWFGVTKDDADRAVEKIEAEAMQELFGHEPWGTKKTVVVPT